MEELIKNRTIEPKKKLKIGQAEIKAFNYAYSVPDYDFMCRLAIIRHVSAQKISGLVMWNRFLFFFFQLFYVTCYVESLGIAKGQRRMNKVMCSRALDLNINE